MMSMKRISFGLIVAALLAFAPIEASAAGSALTTLSTSVYTDLGVAPVMVQNLSGKAVKVVVADSLPSAITLGFTLDVKQTLTFNAADASSHVYALSQAVSGVVAYAPVYGSSGGGGGAVTIADGADGTLGAKADAKSAATDTTAITAMQALKEISAMEQAPASRVVTQPTSANLNMTEASAASILSAINTLNGKIDTLNGNVTHPIPTQAPTVSIGGVGIVDSAGTNVATVKAANTPPVASTDKALVVGIPNGFDIGEGGVADSAGCGSTNGINPCLKQLHADVTSAATFASQYPAGAVPLNPATGIGTTGAASATLTPVSGHTAYICGYSIRANATAAVDVADTISGIVNGSNVTHELWVAPVASGLGVDEQIFTPCRPAYAVTTNIVVNSGAPGTGGNVTVDAWGFSL
jgi:hypothetical protein